MAFNKFKEYSYTLDGNSHEKLNEMAQKAPAKKTSGTVQQTIGFTKLFEDFDNSAQYFEAINGMYVAKVIHEIRTPAQKDIERELNKRKAQLRKDDPEIKFTRSKTTEMRKQIKEELRATTAPTQTSIHVVLNPNEKRAWLSVSNKAMAESLEQMLGIVGIRVIEESYSIDIESDLTNMLHEPADNLTEEWELGKAASLKNQSDSSKAVYSGQDLVSQELDENIDREKKVEEIELIFREYIKCRLNTRQAVTNIKLLTRQIPDWLEYSSESGEGELSEVDAIRAEWHFFLSCLVVLANAVKELFGEGDVISQFDNSSDLKLDFSQSN